MVRKLMGLALAAILAATAGCRMCADPYDYCGPLFTGNACGPPCGANDRTGSILQHGPCNACGCQPCECQSGASVGEYGPEMVVPEGPSDIAPGELVPTPDSTTAVRGRGAKTVSQSRPVATRRTTRPSRPVQARYVEADGGTMPGVEGQVDRVRPVRYQAVSRAARYR